MEDMEERIDTFIKTGSSNYKDSEDTLSYGTAGFRYRSDLLDTIIYKSALIISLRSLSTRAVVGIIITASHNPEQDNGIKFVDYNGEMLCQEWERIANDIGNARWIELKSTAMQVFSDQCAAGSDYSPHIFIARDTRASGIRLLSRLTEGLDVLGTKYTDYGIMTTPQLHYMVKCAYTQGGYGIPTEIGYYTKMATAFKLLMNNFGVASSVVKVDGANGVGGLKVMEFASYVSDYIQFEIFNRGSPGILNYKCGADFVKNSQLPPSGITLSPSEKCACFDGDADRLILCFYDSEGVFKVIDGDKIASLIAAFFSDILSQLQLDLTMSVVQTAYANGSSTKYLSETLSIPVACTATGVKHLQREAHKFDIGIFFESNGHGTIIFSSNAETKISNLATDERVDNHQHNLAIILHNIVMLVNQTTGDALSDLLLVEAILAYKKWDYEDFYNMYQDLPNRQVKVKVKDRSIVTTTDAERKCVTPNGLQKYIDELTRTIPRARAFVRPSGTENIVRVYAEATSQQHLDDLIVLVAQKVYNLAEGIGEIPQLT